VVHPGLHYKLNRGVSWDSHASETLKGIGHPKITFDENVLTLRSSEMKMVLFKDTIVAKQLYRKLRFYNRFI